MEEPRKAFETMPSIHSLQEPEQSTQSVKRKVPRDVMDIILDLGLLFRPLSQSDHALHAAKVDLLAQHVADVPAKWLAIAKDQWVRGNRFLPSAADLIRLAQEAQRAASTQTVGHQGKDWYAHYLAKCVERNRANAMSGDAALMAVVWVPKYSGGAEIMSADACNREIERQRILKDEGRKYDKRFLDLTRATHG